jgi:hypothetical protein
MNCPWYKFWNPHSGIIGGFIFGALVALSIGILARIFL